MNKFAPGRVPHEITLYALTRNDNGTVSIVDIVETSNKFASKFVRAWLRDPAIAEIGTHRPTECANVLPHTNRRVARSEPTGPQSIDAFFSTLYMARAEGGAICASRQAIAKIREVRAGTRATFDTLTPAEQAEIDEEIEAERAFYAAQEVDYEAFMLSLSRT